MTDLDLSFLAQSLDNRFLDPVEVNNRRLTEDDVGERQEFDEKISKVSLGGTRVFSEGLHNAFLHGDKFLLETPSDQLDVGGINAPLLCYGSVPDDPPESWPKDVVKAMVGFAERIGRTISDDNQKTACLGVEAILEAILKKKKREMRRRIMLWVAVGLAIVLVFWMIYKILFKE